jgi:hypothetical protein
MVLGATESFMRSMWVWNPTILITAPFSKPHFINKWGLNACNLPKKAHYLLSLECHKCHTYKKESGILTEPVYLYVKIELWEAVFTNLVY